MLEEGLDIIETAGAYIRQAPESVVDYLSGKPLVQQVIKAS